MITKQELIRFLIDQQALRFGHFTLKSGISSPFFINIGEICTGSGLNFLGQALAERIRSDYGRVDVLFGPPYKAISMVTAAAMAYWRIFGDDVATLYHRKEAKAHGERGLFVGREPQAGDRIVVIDDVLTTGGTKVEAIALVEQTFSVKVEGILVVADRRTKGQDSGLEGYSFSALINLTDVIAFLNDNGQREQAQLLKQFYEGNDA